MKVSLAYPKMPVRAEVLPPINLAYLSAYLLSRNDQISVDVIDLNVNSDINLLARTSEASIVVQVQRSSHTKPAWTF